MSNSKRIILTITSSLLEIIDGLAGKRNRSEWIEQKLRATPDVRAAADKAGIDIPERRGVGRPKAED